jgi:alkaline phosphatase D
MDQGSPITRRTFVSQGIAATVGAGALIAQRTGGSAASAAPAEPAELNRAVAVAQRRTPPPTPFTLGVASGDPAEDGMVLWTRLARRPLDPTGLGGMPARDVDVEWQLARDPGFADLVRTGTVTARHASAHSVHVELTGLEPGAAYFYRFRGGGHISPVGRTRCAPAAASREPLHVAVASCANYEHGYFTAYRHLAESDPDLVVHLGDYLYEMEAGADVVGGGTVRDHAGPRTTTLADYRLRHAQYKTDPDLQQAHAAAPWAVSYDDHDVLDGWAGYRTALPADRAGFHAIRWAAFQAYYENLPLRAGSHPTQRHMQMFRRLTWGQVATIHLLDTRQYRDVQPCRPGYAAECPERFDPTRSMLGHRQEAWLAEGLRGSTAVWDLLAQQVFFSPNRSTRARHGRSHTLGGWNMDSWDGYTAARDRVLDAVQAAAVRNMVVLSGDVHSAWVGEILRDFGTPDSAPLGVELVATSISSGGDGRARTPWGTRSVRTQPYLKYFDRRRGWLALRCTPEWLQADFEVVPYVSRRGAPVSTAATYLLEAGRAGIRRL